MTSVQAGCPPDLDGSLAIALVRGLARLILGHKKILNV
jgi:hypothetical protein